MPEPTAAQLLAFEKAIGLVKKKILVLVVDTDATNDELESPGAVQLLVRNDVDGEPDKALLARRVNVYDSDDLV